MEKENIHQKEQPNNPMHGVKLITILESLLEHYGWENLSMKININCLKKILQLSRVLSF